MVIGLMGRSRWLLSPFRGFTLPAKLPLKKKNCRKCELIHQRLSGGFFDVTPKAKLDV
jgi:hypothetical protein